MSIPEHIAEEFSLCSHAADDQTARLYFDRAWRAVETQLRYIAVGVMRDRRGNAARHEVDGALSLTSLSLWLHLRGADGRTPMQRTIGGGLIRKTVVSRTERYIDGEDRVTTRDLSLSTLDEDEPTGDSWLADGRGLDHDSGALVEQLAISAERDHGKPQWAACLRQIAAGHRFKVDIAKALDQNENTVRFWFAQIRMSGLLDSVVDRNGIASNPVEAHAELVAALEQLGLFDLPAPVVTKRERAPRPSRLSFEQIELIERDPEAVPA